MLVDEMPCIGERGVGGGKVLVFCCANKFQFYAPMLQHGWKVQPVTIRQSALTTMNQSGAVDIGPLPLQLSPPPEQIAGDNP